MPIKALPVYELKIDDNSESELSVSYIALVDRPATERNFLSFKAAPTARQNFSVIDTKRGIVSGLFMAADELIYRNDKEFGEYNTFFSPETIYLIAQKFFELGYQNNLNIMHDANQKTHGVTVFESFMSDPERGIMPMRGFEDTKPGSWFGSIYIKNPVVITKVQTGEIKGFSIEGIFSYINTADEAQMTEAQLTEYNSIINLIK